jgi:hypothetical protein
MKQLLLLVAMLPACGGVTMFENNTTMPAQQQPATTTESTPDYSECVIDKRDYRYANTRLYYTAYVVCDNEEKLLGKFQEYVPSAYTQQQEDL